jgi:hypothetical protein
MNKQTSDDFTCTTTEDCLRMFDRNTQLKVASWCLNNSPSATYCTFNDPAKGVLAYTTTVFKQDNMSSEKIDEWNNLSNFLTRTQDVKPGCLKSDLTFDYIQNPISGRGEDARFITIGCFSY